jgi:predicted nucleic acid-binding Zn ribbon protein
MGNFGGPPKSDTTKICVVCEKEFHPKSGAALVCSEECREIRRLEKYFANKKGLNTRIKYCSKCGEKFVKAGNQKTCDDCLSNRKIGVGTGNYMEKSEDSPSYKHGKYSFSSRYLAYLGEENWFCERCNLDLRHICKTREHQGQWSVHHKDRNRSHQDFSNLELLCITCHNNEHKNWLENWVCNQ